MKLLRSAGKCRCASEKQLVENLSNRAIFNGAFESNQAITLVVVLFLLRLVLAN